MRLYLVLTPSLIEHHIHYNAGEADMILDHAPELHFVLLLLCKTGHAVSKTAPLEGVLPSEGQDKIYILFFCIFTITF